MLVWGHAQQDSLVIKSYDDKIMIRATVDTNVDSYTFYNPKEASKDTKLSINNKIKTSLSIDYGFISASLSFAPKFIANNKDNSLKGSSSYSDISFRFTPKRFIQTVYYHNIKGFYVKNTKDFVVDWHDRDAYILYPNFKVQSFGGATAYVLNKNFSAKGIYTQSEWQTQSNGSFMPLLDYDYTILKNDDDSFRTKETQFNIGANMSYLYNWVLADRVSITPYVALGVAGKFSTNQNNINGNNMQRINAQFIGMRFAGGLHIGYNTDHFLFGGKLNFDTSTYTRKENFTAKDSNYYGIVYVGYRFDPPKIVKKYYKKIDDEIPAL